MSLILTGNSASLTIDSGSGITFPSATTQNTAYQTRFKNRIINGNMLISQRGTSTFTVNSGTAVYGIDRFFGQGTGSAGVFTMQQSSNAPTGFSNSLQVAVTTADSSLAATDLYQIVQPIEAYNTNDLAWGTASAKTVTLSFWVYTSLTGTFGGSVFNSNATRSYPFSYTVSSANTWTQVSVTIAGDTSGTWAGTNGVGIYVIWGLGVGSTYSGTAGAWAGAQYNSATGATNVMSSISNTWYLTGVQLEVGATASSFEVVDYTDHLVMCQRYYEAGTVYILGNTSSSGWYLGTLTGFRVTKRTNPTVAVTTTNVYACSSITAGIIAVGSFNSYITSTAVSFLVEAQGTWTATAEL
jgi:hypothetical protein